MKPDLPSAEWVRDVCERLGYTAAPALSAGEVEALTHNKPHGKKSHEPHTESHVCECGQTATRQHGSMWECDRCASLRVTLVHTIRQGPSARMIEKRERRLIRKHQTY